MSRRNPYPFPLDFVNRIEPEDIVTSEEANALREYEYFREKMVQCINSLENRKDTLQSSYQLTEAAEKRLQAQIAEIKDRLDTYTKMSNTAMQSPHLQRVAYRAAIRTMGEEYINRWHADYRPPEPEHEPPRKDTGSESIFRRIRHFFTGK